jgi:putative toxin-antitoxin system antitoxin component (TIGR02293 family)
VEALLGQDAAASPLQDVAAHESNLYALSRKFLGGVKLFRHAVNSRAEVHAAILDGIPYASLIFLLATFKALDEADVVHVLGISARTLRRQREMPRKSMPADLASRTWLFAEMLAKATAVFGSTQRAEEWMARPALGLDGQRPIDLLQTVQGAEIVGDFLTRLEYGVYT